MRIFDMVFFCNQACRPKYEYNFVESPLFRPHNKYLNTSITPFYIGSIKLRSNQISSMEEMTV